MIRFDQEASPCAAPAAGEPAVADATALLQRFGPDGVEWLDRFLADYLFLGEPLDRVLVRARELARLPARPEPVLQDD
jgi:hypothetical protein